MTETNAGSFDFAPEDSVGVGSRFPRLRSETSGTPVRADWCSARSWPPGLKPVPFNPSKGFARALRDAKTFAVSFPTVSLRCTLGYFRQNEVERMGLGRCYGLMRCENQPQVLRLRCAPLRRTNRNH
jgi:hypothetical protein